MRSCLTNLTALVLGLALVGTAAAAGRGDHKSSQPRHSSKRSSSRSHRTSRPHHTAKHSSFKSHRTSRPYHTAKHSSFKSHRTSRPYHTAKHSSFKSYKKSYHSSKRPFKRYGKGYSKWSHRCCSKQYGCHT